MIYCIALINFKTDITGRLRINHLSKYVNSLTAIDYIRNVNKQRPDAEAIYKYISRTEASNVNKTDIVNSIDELVKRNVVVN